MTLRLKALALAAVLAGASQAHAADFTLSLTGMTADFAESPSTSGGVFYDNFYLPLQGLDASNAITVSLGDTIESTVTLDSHLHDPRLAKAHGLPAVLRPGRRFPSENTGVTGHFHSL